MREATTRRTPNPCCAQRPAPKEACGPCHLWGRQGFTRWPERRALLEARPHIRTERWTKLDILVLHQAGSSFWAPLLAPSSWLPTQIGPQVLGCPTSGLPLASPNPSGFGVQPFLAAEVEHLQNWPKSILAEVDIDRSRHWPFMFSVLADLTQPELGHCFGVLVLGWAL